MNRHVHERKRLDDGRFFYHKRWPPSIAARFGSDVRLRILDDAFMATREVFGDERLYPSSGGVLVSVLTIAGDDKGDWDFEYMQSGSSSGREQHRMVQHPGLATHVVLLVLKMAWMHCF